MSAKGGLIPFSHLIKRYQIEVVEGGNDDLVNDKCSRHRTQQGDGDLRSVEVGLGRVTYGEGRDGCKSRYVRPTLLCLRGCVTAPLWCWAARCKKKQQH